MNIGKIEFTDGKRKWVYIRKRLRMRQIMTAQGIMDFRVDLEKRPPKSESEYFTLGAHDWELRILSHLLSEVREDETYGQYVEDETAERCLKFLQELENEGDHLPQGFSSVEQMKEVCLVDFFESREKLSSFLLITSRHSLEWMQSGLQGMLSSVANASANESSPSSNASTDSTNLENSTDESATSITDGKSDM